MSFEPQIKKQKIMNIHQNIQQYNYATRMIPAVTVPLGFLQQLIKQAQLNKELAYLTPIFRKEQSTAIYELIQEIQNKKPQENIQNEESTAFYKEKNFQNTLFLLQSQLKFIKQNPYCKQKVQDYLFEYLSLQPHFWIWINQIEFKSLEDMLILCKTNKNGNRIQNLFKNIFSKLSIDYYQKHAYPEILRSNIEEKMKLLTLIGDILSKINKPSKFIYFHDND